MATPKNLQETNWLSIEVNENNIKTIKEYVDSLNNQVENLLNVLADLKGSLIVSGETELKGNVKIDNLPTSDPGVAGQLYKDSSGNVKISG